MREKLRQFIEIIKTQLDPNILSIRKFIIEKTWINGNLFSFEGHEFQEYFVKLLEDNPGCTFAVSKPSQIGMSELIYRVIMAKLGVIGGTSIVLSMPSLTFSQEVFKTRISKIITSSPYLYSIRDHNNDSASVKAFLNDSILYGLSGSEVSSKSSLVNRPVGWFFIDECDRQNRDIYTAFRSRQSHIPPEERGTVLISTPTVAGFGIDREVAECGIQHEPLVVCDKCEHSWLPDYYKDVVIPGYNDAEELIFKGDPEDAPPSKLKHITKENISALNVDDAYLRCPKCLKDADGPDRCTKWVITKNDPWPKTSIGVKLNPWVAHHFIKIPDLIRASVVFTNEVEWLNQGLGLTALMKDSTIDRSVFAFSPKPDPVGLNIYGLDMGKICTFLRGVLQSDTTIRIVEAAEVGVNDLEEFLVSQHHQHAFSAAVMDQGPLVEMAYRLVRRFAQMYSCVYVTPKAPMPELYKLRLTDKHDQLVRQVSMNRTLGFDSFFGMLADQITWAPTPLQETIIEHFLSLRRIRDYNRIDGIYYKWVTVGTKDHFAHSYIYLCLAAKMAISGVTQNYSLPFEIRKLNINKVKEDIERIAAVGR